MSRALAVLSGIFLLTASVNSYAISISYRTYVMNGLKTDLCINLECKTFDKAISAKLSKKTTDEDYIIEVKYLDQSIKLFDWKKNEFFEEN